jgi:hypothetical protein
MANQLRLAQRVKKMKVQMMMMKIYGEKRMKNKKKIKFLKIFGL